MRIRLKYKSITSLVSNQSIALVVLVNEDETKQIAITCDEVMAQEILLRQSHETGIERRLPEVFAHFLALQMDDPYEVVINNVIDGEYRALLTDHSGIDMVPIRAIDAILLAIAAHLSIFIEEELMTMQQVDFHNSGDSMQMPINGFSEEMLQEALKKAIENENYEMASHLRDELNRRKQGDNQTDATE